MFKKIEIKDKIKCEEVYPISYNIKNKMTSVIRNEKLKQKKNYKYPPGISILKLKKSISCNKLYKIIHDMYNNLNIPIKNGVLAYIGEERKGQKYYIPGDNFENYLKKHKKKITDKLHIYSHLPTKKESVIDIINSLHISSQNKKYLITLCIKLLKTYIQKKDYDKINSILDKSRLFFLRYSGYHGGHRLHIDNPIKRNGSVFLINLGNSIIDYIPYREITNKNNNYKAYRFNIKPGEIFIMDGDSRVCYTHGVPPNTKNANYLRYVMVIRVPAFYKKDKLCYLSQKYMKKIHKKYEKKIRLLIKEGYPCYSNIQDIKV